MPEVPPAAGARRRAPARHRGRNPLRALALGVPLLLVVALLAGWLLVRGDTTPPRDRPAPARATQTTADSVSPDLLLDVVQVSNYTPHQSWHEVTTSDNTSGTGINSICQDQRFADPRGVGTIVRTFESEGTPRRSLVQTIEISRSEGAARAAYRTTLGWFAGCDAARLELLGSYRVTGLGEQSQVVKLRIPNKVRRTYVVGLVRTGSLTLSTVLETLDGDPPEIQRAVEVLYQATRRLCDADAAGACPSYARAAPTLPPRSGETPGTLAAADLPAVGTINRRWVGTRPVPANPNVAATSCDRADFRRSGAPRAATRVFLVPRARVPRTFGITETYGGFRSTTRAAAFVGRIREAMAGCPKRDLGAKVGSAVSLTRGYRGSEYHLWRLDSEIAEDRTVGYWMGVARVGRYVAQVTFTPAGDADVDTDTFQALVSRARDRLFELPR